MLRIENLYARYQTRQGDVKALNGIDLALNEGEVFCLVGESGAGKSTLALAIMGMLPPSASIDQGSVFYDGVDLLRADEEYLRRLRGQTISLIFEDAQSALNPLKLIGDQIEEVVRLHTDAKPRSAYDMGQEMLRELGIPDPRRVMGQYPSNLSGGMCQRVMLAMALVLGPRLLIADEPTSGLDVTLQAEVLDHLRRLCRERRASILLITHDMAVVATMAQRVGVMYAGAIVETADVVPLFKRPRHPYTWALLQSIPRLDDPGKNLRPLAGSPPNMIALPDECPYLPRCHKALNQCRASPRPPSRELEDSHSVACYNPMQQAR